MVWRKTHLPNSLVVKLTKDKTVSYLIKFERDRIEIRRKLSEVNEEYEKYEVGEVVTDYIDVMMEELDKQYSIQRFSDKEVIINKYIEEVKVKYVGK